jgi:hypothetical protein
MEERRRRSKRVVIVMVAVRTVLGMIANLKIIKIFLISSTARYATLVNNISYNHLIDGGASERCLVYCTVPGTVGSHRSLVWWSMKITKGRKATKRQRTARQGILMNTLMFPFIKMFTRKTKAVRRVHNLSSL